MNNLSFTSSFTVCVVETSEANCMRTVFFLDITPEVYASIYWLNAGSTSTSFGLLLQEKRIIASNSKTPRFITAVLK